MRESEFAKRVLLAVHKIPGVRLFRNNVGKAWIGNRARKLKPGETVRAQGGEVLLYNGRPFHAGLVNGSGDYIGWRETTVTPDMVGQRVAIFTSMENKTPGDRMRKGQKTWHQRVLEAGGISVIARSPEQAFADLEWVDIGNRGEK